MTRITPKYAPFMLRLIRIARQLAFVGFAICTSLSLPARAQDAFPNKPIRLTVPYPAGGVVDLVARIVADKLSAELKQPIIVEARPGANANIGTEAVLRAPADGYNLLMVAPYLVTSPLLANNSGPSVKWKTSDFVGIGIVGAPPNVFVIPSSSPQKTLTEFIEHAKANRGKLNVSNPGIGTSNHLGQELLFNLTKIDLSPIAYKGQPQIIPDLASGQIHFGLITLAIALPHIKEGKLRALAISAPRRSPDLPEIPTLAEAGFAEAIFLPWFGIVAPAGTPKPIVKRLSDEMQKALQSPDVIQKLDRIGTQLTPGNAEDFDKLLQSETQRWSKLIRERQIKAE